MAGVEPQMAAFDRTYETGPEQWAFHYTDDRLTRYLRDRRLRRSLAALQRRHRLDPEHQSVLVVCGGVGGEATYLRNRGFKDLTVSDFSEESLRLCRTLDPRLNTANLNAESLDLPDRSFDLVFVQDGLHHLPRPTLGFTEMLRVARQAVVIIEPYRSLVGARVGTEWERQGDAINYVFRWDRNLLNQVTRSYLLSETAAVDVQRFWDHSLTVGRVVGRLPTMLRYRAAQVLYGTLCPWSFLGNMMVGVVLKDDGIIPTRLVGH